jgi:hypothetical protein
MSEFGQFGFALAIGMMGLGFTLGPIGQAIGRLIGSKSGRDPKTGLTTGEMASQRVEALEERVRELEQALSRAAELEERVDFAERLLAQLPPGQPIDPERR